jgi:hypothetical protein
VIVHAHVREMRGHALDGPRSAELEKRVIAGGVELEQRGSELEALRPFGPSPRLIAAADWIFPAESANSRSIFGSKSRGDRRARGGLTSRAR